MDSMHEKCLEYTFGITVELNKQNLGLPFLSLVICVIILPAQQFLLLPKTKIKVCGAYNKIILLFFDNFPWILAINNRVLVIMAFGFSYAR